MAQPSSPSRLRRLHPTSQELRANLFEERLKVANVVLPEDNLEDLVQLPIAPELVSRRLRSKHSPDRSSPRLSPHAHLHFDHHHIHSAPLASLASSGHPSSPLFLSQPHGKPPPQQSPPLDFSLSSSDDEPTHHQPHTPLPIPSSSGHSLVPGPSSLIPPSLDPHLDRALLPSSSAPSSAPSPYSAEASQSIPQSLDQLSPQISSATALGLGKPSVAPLRAQPPSPNRSYSSPVNGLVGSSSSLGLPSAQPLASRSVSQPTAPAPSPTRIRKPSECSQKRAPQRRPSRPPPASSKRPHHGPASSHPHSTRPRTQSSTHNPTSPYSTTSPSKPKPRRVAAGTAIARKASNPPVPSPARFTPRSRPRSISTSSVILDSSSLPPWTLDPGPRMYRVNPLSKDQAPRFDDLILPTVARQLEKNSHKLIILDSSSSTTGLAGLDAHSGVASSTGAIDMSEWEAPLTPLLVRRLSPLKSLPGHPALQARPLSGAASSRQLIPSTLSNELQPQPQPVPSPKAPVLEDFAISTSPAVDSSLGRESEVQTLQGDLSLDEEMLAYPGSNPLAPSMRTSVPQVGKMCQEQETSADVTEAASHWAHSPKHRSPLLGDELRMSNSPGSQDRSLSSLRPPPTPPSLHPPPELPSPELTRSHRYDDTHQRSYTRTREVYPPEQHEAMVVAPSSQSQLPTQKFEPQFRHEDEEQNYGGSGCCRCSIV